MDQVRLSCVTHAMKFRSSALTERRHRNVDATGRHQKPRVFHREGNEISWSRNFRCRGATKEAGRSR
jgi:hypothetical protein